MLYDLSRQTPVKEEITQRKIDHTLLRKPDGCRTRQALTWNPQGSHKRGRPMNTWRRDIDRERERMEVTWGEMFKTAEDRDSGCF